MVRRPLDNLVGKSQQDTPTLPWRRKSGDEKATPLSSVEFGNAPDV